MSAKLNLKDLRDFKVLKVLVLETDYYASQTINSYLAWDRRTRVVHLADTIESVVAYVRHADRTEWPDVVVLDALATGTPSELARLVELIENTIPNVLTLVLDRQFNIETIRAVERVGANGYLLRNEIQIRLASAICWAR